MLLHFVHIGAPVCQPVTVKIPCESSTKIMVTHNRFFIAIWALKLNNYQYSFRAGVVAAGCRFVNIAVV